MILWRVIDTDTRECAGVYTKEMPAQWKAHDLNTWVWHAENPGQPPKRFSSDYPSRFHAWQDPDLPGLN